MQVVRGLGGSSHNLLPPDSALPPSQGSAIKVCRFGSENHSIRMHPLSTRLDDDLPGLPGFDRHSLALITASLRVHLIIASCSGADKTIPLSTLPVGLGHSPHVTTTRLNATAHAIFNRISAYLDVHTASLSKKTILLPQSNHYDLPRGSSLRHEVSTWFHDLVHHVRVDYMCMIGKSSSGLSSQTNPRPLPRRCKSRKTPAVVD